MGKHAPPYTREQDALILACRDDEAVAQQIPGRTPAGIKHRRERLQAGAVARREKESRYNFTHEQDLAIGLGDTSPTELARLYGVARKTINNRRNDLRRRRDMGLWPPSQRVADAFAPKGGGGSAGEGRFARPAWFNEPDPRYLAMGKAGNGCRGSAASAWRSVF